MSWPSELLPSCQEGLCFTELRVFIVTLFEYKKTVAVLQILVYQVVLITVAARYKA
jgi:hypothetical protein